MWGKINAEKLKTIMSSKRETQQKSVKNEKTKVEDSESVKMDSGFLSGGILSCDDILTVEDDQYDIKSGENPKETMRLMDSGVCDSGCLSEYDQNTDLTKQPQNGPDVNFYFQQNEDGDTQLHLAIIHDYIEVSKRLIKICPDPKLLDLRNDDGQSALHLAVVTNQCEIVQSLMMANANAGLLDYDGNTAVHLACYGGKLDCLRIIANYEFLPKMLDFINYDGLACIHIATIHNHLNVLEFVVNCSRNVNITDYKSGYTALHFAVALNRVNLIECLLDKVDPNIESYAGKLAFEVGCDYDYDEDDEDDETSEDLVKSINLLQLPVSSPIKC